MPEIVETNVYQFHELSEEAKEKARAWYREGALDYDWYEGVFGDFETVCTILGIRLKSTQVLLMGGGTRSKPRIYFTGFWNQGDGASYECIYSYARRAPAKIREYAPRDSELHRIADVLQAVQRRNFYQLHAEATHRGHYHHENSMTISVDRNSPTNQGMTEGAEDIVAEVLRDLARWLFQQLEHEWEYQTCDTTIDEAIVGNNYTFTETGCGR